jgi:hypothetical protein
MATKMVSQELPAAVGENQEQEQEPYCFSLGSETSFALLEAPLVGPSNALMVRNILEGLAKRRRKAPRLLKLMLTAAVSLKQEYEPRLLRRLAAWRIDSPSPLARFRTQAVHMP